MSVGKSIAVLLALGWKSRGPGKCRSCGAPIEWFQDRQRKFVAMTRDADGLLAQHVCPGAVA